MIDLRSLILVQKLKWVKLYINGHNCLWRGLMESLINVHNLNVFLRSDYDMNDKITNSIFYIDVITSMYKLNCYDRSFIDGNLRNQFIFYNKMIKIDGNLVYDDELFKAGLWTFGDLFDIKGDIIPFAVWKLRGVPQSKYIIWMAIVSIVTNAKIRISNSCINIPHKCVLLPTEDVIDIQECGSREMYNKIVKLRKEKPTALKSHFDKFSLLDEKEVENMFIIPRMCTRDMKMKEFQYKILHRYLPTNDLLYKMKKVSSKKCSFCNLYNDTVIHMFYECFCIKELWYMVFNVLQLIDNSVKTLTCKEVILGFDLKKISPLNLIINNVILHVKMYLWKCKCFDITPTYNNFKDYIKDRRNMDKSLEVVYGQM